MHWKAGGTEWSYSWRLSSPAEIHIKETGRKIREQKWHRKRESRQGECLSPGEPASPSQAPVVARPESQGGAGRPGRLAGSRLMTTCRASLPGDDGAGEPQMKHLRATRPRRRARRARTEPGLQELPGVSQQPDTGPEAVEESKQAQGQTQGRRGRGRRMDVPRKSHGPAGPDVMQN